MQKMMKGFCLMFGLAAAVASYGQNADAKEASQAAPNQKVNGAEELTLSLDEAVRYAIEHNRTLKNANLDVQKAEYQRWQTISKMLLQIDGSAQYYNMFGYKMDLGQFQIDMPPYGTLTLQAAAGVSAQGIVGAQMQRIAKELQEVNAQKSEQTVRYQVETVYTSILAMEETVKLLNQTMENLEKMKEMTENAVKVGAAEQNTANQIAIQVASMKSAVNANNRRIEALYNALVLQIGAEYNTHITLTQKIEDLLNDETVLQLLTSSFNLDDNFDYQLLKKNTEIVNKQKQMAVAAFLPTVSAAYQLTGKHYFEDSATTMNSTPPNTFVATVSLPIFSSGNRTCAVKEAKVSQMENENTVKDAEIGLMVQDKQLRYDLSSAYDNYLVQRDNIKVMESVFESYGEKFKYGRASSMEVTNSSTDLVQAQANYISSVLEVINANIALKKLLNK